MKTWIKPVNQNWRELVMNDEALYEDSSRLLSINGKYVEYKFNVMVPGNWKMHWIPITVQFQLDELNEEENVLETALSIIELCPSHIFPSPEA